eukprot:CAMPEP_0177632156 /NCGR_PEP_ID=MMETSP0447-20121125/2138_1 /TAXON_ID=0 /ORGANISM="Stygamoeba regulata, Strain BSH-02190019" /LENGTH=182 /DNA_ID=CAMNT_0019133699 /DNA_START=26 /DNA_END=571 /DNA_ORIENTATION=-
MASRSTGGGGSRFEMASHRPSVVNQSCIDYLSIEMVQQAREHTDGSSEALFQRLEWMGFNVGQKLVERHSKNAPLLSTHLDRVKFICKEFWTLLFHKKIDNLKTNHRGVFVLQDKQFRWLAHISGKRDAIQETTEWAASYVYFPCGMIRGALFNLGMNCVVHPEITDLPGCKFTIKVKSSTK